MIAGIAAYMLLYAFSALAAADDISLFVSSAFYPVSPNFFRNSGRIFF
jgi:hypothetical protein